MSSKSEVLSVLESQKGIYISGEALARKLGISRAAVWKAIGELREEGYRITALTRKGYLLENASDLLSAEAVRLFLRREPGREIICRKLVSSTNQAAKELALSGAPDGALLLAEEQSEGRGRRGRGFVSPPGAGIYLSALLRPQLLAADAVLITAAAAVAVCEAVQALCGIDLGIKWVNDLYLGDRKVCGILTEAATDFESGSVEYMVVGIGINFTTRPEDFPEELRTVAGSLFPKGEAPVSRSQLAAEIVNRLEELLPGLPQRRFLAAYRARSILLGERVEVLRGEKREIARAVAIDDDARLVIQKEDNTTEALRSGEISIRRKPV
ncbi:biotin--[acetyl-CoA-carboxylase] ligase [Anaerotruncus sp. AF02-27]|uniref:biotin--[acetyl-CoA-carboxylase] ligase n=1 Tax=Anaerotruncus TaxID=244127 RepID=UPI000E486E48|nr:MULTISPECIES: biotin--[acetyl-CoA-carboxylase] ligase [Anaerotruncus]RGX55946.1 biotin--[acetyl-CoA-carboxylase] ligase [Anaerotruncus sp. AF02-27]